MKRIIKAILLSGAFLALSGTAVVSAAENQAYDPAWAQALSQVAVENTEAQLAAAAQAAQIQAQQAAAAQAAQAAAQIQAQQAAAAQAAQAAAQIQAQQAAAAQAAQAAAQIQAQQAAAAQAAQAAAQIQAQQAAAAQAAVPQEGMPGTYIDVSIDNQTLVYFVNGTPAIITPCVTGSPGRSTPRGVFAINSMIPGKRLVGPTWNVWVNRWMRFSGNCGIHDANWRKKFGGDIYRHNGSHGCVNIPYDQAMQLYSMVGIGTTVIVH